MFGIGGEWETPIDLIHHDSLRFHERSSRGRSRPLRGKTYPAGGTGRVVGVVEEDYSRPTCKGAGSFQTWGITGERTSTGARKLVLLDMFTTELDNLVQGSGWAPVTGLCSAHYFDERDGLVAIGWYEEGTRFLDVRGPAGIRQVGYWVPTKGETWSVLFPPTDPTGSVVYALDFARGIDVLGFGRPPRTARPRAALVCASGRDRPGRAPAAPGSAARPTSASSAGCRAAVRRRRRSRSCLGSGCRHCRDSPQGGPAHLRRPSRGRELEPEPPAAVGGEHLHARQGVAVKAAFDHAGRDREGHVVARIPYGCGHAIVALAVWVGEGARPWQAGRLELVGGAAHLRLHIGLGQGR